MTVSSDKVCNFTLLNEEKSEEVLGSVTHEAQTNDRCFPIQLRTSARVSKKLKLDSQNVISPIPLERKEMKLEEKISEQKSNTARRVHELWSTEDKNAFFEALNEYGKDFDAIQTHMNNKRKKRGISHNISKNRDQARHFYYRTWHKISKYLKFPQEVKKVVREQYGLINFGEFRKKVGFVSEKNSMKLNELIYSGNTQVRVKGKTVRIKTPVCRALRKLNQLQETSADVKLPTRILIELRPRNNESWCHVQSLAMNPRVRTTLPLQQLLLSLIAHLQKKWQLPRAEINDLPSNSVFVENIAMPMVQEEKDTKLILRIAPKQGINIVPPSIRSGEFVTSSNISLMAYEEKFGLEGISVSENLKLNVNKHGKSHRTCRKHTVEDEKFKTATESDNNSLNNVCNDSALVDADFVSSTVNQLLSLNNDSEISAKDGTEELDWNSPTKDEFELDSEMTCSENKEEIIRRAKAGWTIKNADTIRIGDLYLMFGTESKLQLDYWWDSENDNEDVGAEKLSSFLSSAQDKKKELSRSLGKLISIAKLYLNKDKDRCLCGHICKSSNNKFINGRGRIVNKTKNNFNTPHVNDNEKIIPNTFSETTQSLKAFTPLNSLLAVNRTNSVSHATPRTVSSFKEQLDLQYYNRRRNGDKQRILPLVPKVTIQVIKPKEAINSVDTVAVEENKIGHETSKEAISDNLNSRINLDVANTASIDLEDVTRLTSKQLLELSDGEKKKATNGIGSTLLLQDEDTKSSCSTITRFLKQALPGVVPQSANPSPDGLSTPIISRSNNRTILDSNGDIHNGRESPTWSVSEASNFSIGNLFTQYDLSTKPAVTADEETRFSADVETQFQRLINESSVDYTEKFANLAAQIASETVIPKI